MKRFLTACAVVILASGVLGGCSQGNTSVQTATGASIISLSPSVVIYGGPQFSLTVFASTLNGFNSNTTVQWNGQNLVSTYVDVSTMTAIVPASLIAKPGTAYVNVHAPQRFVELAGADCCGRAQPGTGAQQPLSDQCARVHGKKLFQCHHHFDWYQFSSKLDQRKLHGYLYRLGHVRCADGHQQHQHQRHTNQGCDSRFVPDRGRSQRANRCNQSAERSLHCDELS
jgi:hypothetical protein